MLPALLRLVPLAAVCLAAAPAAPPAERPSPTVDDVPLPSFDRLPTPAEFRTLASTDAVAALQASIARGRREVRGYRAIFLKQERIGGKLHPLETIEVAFREDPFAVRMRWKSGARTAAEGTLFVRGENRGHMLVRVKKFGLATTAPFGTADAIARGSSRYGIEDFGIVQGSVRTLKSWAAAKERGELDVEYLGRKPVADLGGKECFAIRRTCRADSIDSFVMTDPPVAVTDANRPDSFRTVTIYFDPDTWLQVGAEQTRADGQRVGAYFFQDVALNPHFERGEFAEAALKR